MKKKVMSLVLSLILAGTSVIPSYAADSFSDGTGQEIDQETKNGTKETDLFNTTDEYEEMNGELFDDQSEQIDIFSEEDVNSNEEADTDRENVLTASEGDFEYEVVNNEVNILKYLGNKSLIGNVEVPSMLGGYPVTSIGAHAFEYSRKIKIIDLPETLMNIGEYAFSECDFLDNVHLPDNLISIGKFAFGECDALKNIEFPNSLKTIGNRAFWRCRSLKELNLPDSVTSIEEGAFMYCRFLNSIHMPSNLEYIGSLAFEDCVSLSSIDLPDNLTSIGAGAFQGCTSLANVSFPDSLINIGNDIFAQCTSLTEIDLPDSLRYVSVRAFSGCTSLINVDLSNTLTLIEGQAFNGCTNLTNIDLPDSLITIDNFAFSKCSNLINIKLPNKLNSIGYNAFEECKNLLKIYIPKTVIEIMDNAFYGCDNITIYGELGSIAEKYANENGIPFFSVSSDDEYNQMRDFEYKIDGNRVTILNYLGNDQDVIIPSTIEGYPVTRIETFASFGSEDNLRSVFLPVSINEIGGFVFPLSETFAIWGYSGSYAETYADSYNIQFIAYYRAEDVSDFEFRIDGKEITILKYRGADQHVVVPSVIDGCRVTRIEEGAFILNNTMSEIDMPYYLKSVENSAFSQCLRLHSIIMPQHITELGIESFYSCTALTDIVLPSTVTSIGRLSFNNCTNLSTINLPENLECIEYGLFNSCTSLSSISIPEHVKTIEEYAFYNCSNLKKVIIPKGVTDISDNAFENCSTELIIYGYAGSYAETYAEKCNIHFVMLDSFNVTPAFDYLADEKTITWSKNRYSEEEININIGISFSAPVTIKQIDIKLDNLKMFKVKESNRETNDLSIYTYSIDKNERINGKGSFQVTLVKKGFLSWWKPSDANLHSGKITVIVKGERDNGLQLSNETNNTKELILNYQNKDKAEDAEKKAEEEAEKNTEDLTNIAVEKFDDIDDAITLDIDIEDKIGKNQFQALKMLVYSEISLANISKSYFTSSGLSDKIAEKLMSKYLGYEKPIFGISDKTVPIQVVIQGEDKKLYQLELNCFVQTYDVKGTRFGMNGRIETQMWEVSAPNKKKNTILCDLGMINQADIGEFANGVWEVAKSSLQSAFKNVWGNEADKAANGIMEGSIDSMASMAAKYGLEKPVQLLLKKFYEKKLKSKFSEKFFQLLIYPSKLVVAQCPVDVYVYNGDNLVGSIVGDQISINGDGIALWTEGDDKYIQLFDETYQVRYEASGTGTMTLDIYDQMLNNINYRKCEFLRIPLEDQTAYVQKINNELLIDAENYKLTSDQGESFEITTEEITSSDVYPDSHTHVWDAGVVTKEASCIETGIMTYTCICGELKTEEIPVTDHAYGEWTITKEATVSEEGERQRICTVCGHAEKEVIPRLPSEPEHSTTPTPELTPSPEVSPAPAPSVTPAPEVSPVPVPALDVPELKTSTVLGTRKIVFNWYAAENADGYQIFKWDQKSEKYTLLKTILASSGKLKYEKLFAFGTACTFRMRIFRFDIDGTTRVYGEFGPEVKVEIPKYSKFVKPQVKAAVKTGQNKVYLTWNEIGDADGYKVYIYNKSNKKYDLVKTISGSGTTSYVQTGLTPAASCAFRVRSFAVKEDRTEVNGRISATAKAVTPPRRPVGISAVSKVKGQSAVSWKKTDNARGYRIYRNTSPDGVFRQIKTITRGRTVTFIDRNVESGTTYYYKIRAFTVNPNGSRSFGKISAVKAVKIK